MPAIVDTRTYASPGHVPVGWVADRPGELHGPQPHGDRLGTPGPDQGFALRIARRLESELIVAAGESVDDVIGGCVNIALRRASLYSRAPVVHDLRMAFTIWGLFDPAPPDELVAARRRLFEGVANTAHHYAEGRHLADLVPEWVLRSTPGEIVSQYPARWAALTGVDGSAPQR
jgi:hypothetical protein